MADGVPSSLCIQKGHECTPASQNAWRDLQERVVHGAQNPLCNGSIESANDDGHSGSGRDVCRRKAGIRAASTPKNKSNKAPVVSLVERGGKVRSFHTEMVTGKTLKQVVRENVASNTHVMTDDHPGYSGLGKHFRRHSTIRHSWKVYARKEGDVLISTNTIEGYFSILKRGINGVYHHVGKQHLHRYLSEFDFRYNSRHVEDGERSLLAIKKVTGKRPKYRDSSGS